MPPPKAPLKLENLFPPQLSLTLKGTDDSVSVAVDGTVKHNHEQHIGEIAIEQTDLKAQLEGYVLVSCYKG